MGWHHDQVWLFTVSEFDNARSWIPGKHGLRDLGSGKVGLVVRTWLHPFKR